MLVDETAIEAKQEAEWEKKWRTIRVTSRDKDGVAFFMVDGAKILVSDESWKKIRAREANLYLLHGQRPGIHFADVKCDLARWLMRVQNSDLRQLIQQPPSPRHLRSHHFKCCVQLPSE